MEVQKSTTSIPELLCSGCFMWKCFRLLKKSVEESPQHVYFRFIRIRQIFTYFRIFPYQKFSLFWFFYFSVFERLLGVLIEALRTHCVECWTDCESNPDIFFCFVCFLQISDSQDFPWGPVGTSDVCLTLTGCFLHRLIMWLVIRRRPPSAHGVWPNTSLSDMRNSSEARQLVLLVKLGPTLHYRQQRLKNHNKR